MYPFFSVVPEFFHVISSNRTPNHCNVKDVAWAGAGEFIAQVRRKGTKGNGFFQICLF